MNITDLLKQAEEYLNQDKYDEAIALYEQCIEAAPNVKSNYWQLGLALLLAGREEEAQACWFSVLFEGEPEEIERLTKELLDILQIEGIKYLETGKYEQAEKIYFQFVEQDPKNPIAYKNLGNVLYSQGKLEEAIAYYQEGIELEPNDAITYYHLGNAFHQLNRLEEAIAHYQQSLAISPKSPTVLNNLGNSLQRKGKFEEAIACYQQSITLDSNNALTYNNLGSVFNSQGKMEEALACFQQGLNLEPDNVESYNNLAVSYQKHRQYEKALECCDRAIEIKPNYADAHWNRALILLRLGDYERGFIEYEWRWQRKENQPRFLPKPIWDGSNIEGKTILLQAEQGIGDLIQFIRYVPLLVKLGACIIVESHQQLVRLLRNVEGIDKVVAIGETLPEFDVYIPLLSVPRILGTTLETIPATIPYIAPLKEVRFPLDDSDESYLKVGIVWAGNPKHLDDRKRSTSLQQFLPIFNISHITFYSLQKGPKAAEISEISLPINLVDLNSKINDFADTAAVIAQLDLVITVDTAVAHLAGAMGKPVWVLLCYNPDWRWMIDREDTPWYPSVRLFRQNRSGDWQEVLERVAQTLTEFTRCAL
ncbi:tetratricopeptide repeat protein [Planktothrix sp. FACHB-1355]|uniref:Tetratricopeptide repeat protein n=1 Tax=Aerosakkonema funiforme FACHB-1375 TaxID=2949571 RepID=A0A926ZEB7_9CYAN|nr:MULTISPECIES: tetratricopeptide repeat protein [Oscillatoriales]MBD2179888.1 tetratricopeptide repeat protein [Aerosakkonema funiforme FACHB-1375]MBD3558412.1 tetratricopeptide repeat protein [Planktothrix sp. FACHB-1355]